MSRAPSPSRVATFIVTLGLLALTAAGCGGGDAAKICAPGQSETCTCSGTGKTAKRTCLPDGTQYGACAPCTGGTGAAGSGAGGSGGASCTPGTTQDCTCANGYKGQQYCPMYEPPGGCVCDQPYACHNRKGFESCGVIPIDVCDTHVTGCLAQNGSCTTLSATALDCETWSSIDSCLMFLQCEWLPVSADGGVISGPTELPDAGLPEGPVDTTGTACGAAPATDAGTDGGARDGGCGLSEATGPCVSLTSSPDLGPHAVGGTIVPGTYELVSMKAYGFMPNAMPPQRQTLVIGAASASTFSAATIVVTSATTSRGSFTWHPVSNALLVSESCPGKLSSWQDYTMTGDTLLLFSYTATSKGSEAGEIVASFERR